MQNIDLRLTISDPFTQSEVSSHMDVIWRPIPGLRQMRRIRIKDQVNHFDKWTDCGRYPQGYHTGLI